MAHDFEAWWAGLGPEGDEWPKKALAAAAHGAGLAAERARIRRELLELLEAGSDGIWGLSIEDVDRIVPAEEREG